MTRIWLFTGVVSALILGSPVLAQQSQTEVQKSDSQPNADTTVKQPAGVATPAEQKNTQGMTGAQTGCKSASAKMTNGAEETCK